MRAPTPFVTDCRVRIATVLVSLASSVAGCATGMPDDAGTSPPYDAQYIPQSDASRSDTVLVLNIVDGGAPDAMARHDGGMSSRDGGADVQADVATSPDTGPMVPVDSGNPTPPNDAGSPVDSGNPTPPPDAGSQPTSGTYCQTCASSADCGGSNLCLLNQSTGQQFCGQDCLSTGGACPAGAYCAGIQTPNGVAGQCIPTSGVCGGTTPSGCNPACGSGESCVNGTCQPNSPPPTDAGTPPADSGTPAPDAGSSDDLQHCVDDINMYRAMVGAPPLSRASDLETFAAAGAQYDSMTGMPHSHFISTSGGGIAFAENEIPGWPLANYGSIQAITDQGMAMMWAEGPGGGHYDNMSNTQYTQVGCGYYTTSSGDVWGTQDFR